jgi:hypothetical protein
MRRLGRGSCQRFMRTNRRAGVFTQPQSPRRPTILALDPNAPGSAPKYFKLLQWAVDKIATVRDFRHPCCVVDGAEYHI